MSIDWFTVAAQIVNFLILVWLLKKFLYKPVLNAMEKREQRIAARITEAQDERRKAGRERDHYLALQEEVSLNAEKEMQRAKETAEVYRRQLIDEARKEAEESRMRWLSGIEKEKHAFLEETSRTIAAQFEKLAQGVFKNLADESFESRVVDVFLRELEGLPQQDIESIRRLISLEKQSVIVTSAFELSEPDRTRIMEQVRKFFGADVTFEFVTDTALVSGISMEAAGKKIRWDVGYYLEDFQKNLALTLERNEFD